MGVLTTTISQAAANAEPNWSDGSAPAFSWPVPHPLMRSCVVIPVRNEEEQLHGVIEALAGQRDLDGTALTPASYEILLLLNNCNDQTSRVVRELQDRFPRLHLYWAEVCFAPEEAHVGKARQALFDAAFQRFQVLQRPDGVILTTDADTRPAADWIAQNENEIAKGVDAVGGRILLEPAELAALPAGVRRLFLLDIGYRRALEEMHALFVPAAHDPFPRHHQNFGGSLAITAASYGRAGGMPLRPFREDVALYQAIVHSGGLFRHSEAVRVYTSARVIGRAARGLADAIGWWDAQVREAAPVLVESAAAAEVRFQKLGRWCLDHPSEVPPASLATTPDEPAFGEAEEVQATLVDLRSRLESLRALTLSQRLQVGMGGMR